MRIKRTTAITAAALLTIVTLTLSACGGKKVAPPKPDDEPGLRENKAKMIKNLD